jgi:cobalt-zinc-cadmium efflux system outer membrane protein
MRKRIEQKLLLVGTLLMVLAQSLPAPCAAALPDYPTITLDSVAPQRSVSLHASFDKAVDNNKEVIAAKYNLPVSKALIQIAKAIPNPQFSLLYGFGPAFTTIIAGNPQQFGWKQDFQTAGKRTKAINVAKANYLTTEFQVATTLFAVHNRVRRAYAEQAAAEAYEALIESERTVALELQRIAERRFDAGKAAKSEVLQAELGVLQFETQRNAARNRLTQATAGLSLLIGETPEKVEVIDVDDNGIFKLSTEKSELVPSYKKELPPLDQLLPVAYSQRPDLKVQVQQAHADRKSITLAKAQRIPDLFVDVGYQFSTFFRHQPYGLFTGTVHNQPGCYINYSLEFPIFYQRQGEIAQAKSTWYQDYNQIEQQKFQIATDIVTSYEGVNVARANIIKYQNELIPAAAQVAKLARRSYEVGKGDLATAILAKQQYQQILSSYFDSVVAYQNAWADLENAAGAPLQL